MIQTGGKRVCKRGWLNEKKEEEEEGAKKGRRRLFNCLIRGRRTGKVKNLWEKREVLRITTKNKKEEEDKQGFMKAKERKYCNSQNKIWLS